MRAHTTYCYRRCNYIRTSRSLARAEESRKGERMKCNWSAVIHVTPNKEENCMRCFLSPRLLRSAFARISLLPTNDTYTISIAVLEWRVLSTFSLSFPLGYIYICASRYIILLSRELLPCLSLLLPSYLFAPLPISACYR